MAEGVHEESCIPREPFIEQLPYSGCNTETNRLKMLSVWLMKCFALTVLGQVRLGTQVCVGPSFILPFLYPGLVSIRLSWDQLSPRALPPQACSYWHQRLPHLSIQASLLLSTVPVHSRHPIHVYCVV